MLRDPFCAPGRMATYSGKVIKWDDAIASDLKLPTDAEEWDAKAPIQPLDDGSCPVAMPGISRVL